jgi:predicted acetyltransferase
MPSFFCFDFRHFWVASKMDKDEHSALAGLGDFWRLTVRFTL